MAGFVERISVIIDTKIDGATQGFKKLKADIAEADGAAAKFKAGWSGVSAGVKANAGALALGAASAFAAFAASSVKAFQDTAIAAGKFGDATGLAVDDASRWIEVAGDVGVNADVVQSAFQKMNKSIADGKSTWSEYNVEVIRTAGGVVDANATFQNAITVIGAIADPTLRAKAAQEVFGRSYGEVAELMEMSAEDLKAALDGVGDAQVIDEDELEKAKKFRETMDKVSDALSGVQIAAGEAFVGVVNFLDDATTGAEELGRSLRRTFDSEADENWKTIERFEEATEAAEGFDMSLLDGARTMKDVRSIVMGLGGDAHTANLVFLEWKKGIDATAQAATDSAEAIRGVSSATEELNGLLADLDSEEAALKLDKQFRDLEDSAVDAWNATAEGAEDAAEKQADYQLELIETKRRVAEYGREVLGLPDEKVTELLADIDEGKLAEVNAELDKLARQRNVPIVPQYGAGGLGGSNDRPGGTGGPGAPAGGGSSGSTGGLKGGVESIRGVTASAPVFNINVTVTGGADADQIGEQTALAIKAAIERAGQGTR